jgi:protein-disulfide isomerase
MHRRQILVGALAGAGLLALAPLRLAAQSTVVLEPDAATGLFPTDRVLGDPATAKAILIEYASFSCPHCRDFHQTIVPSLKADWVDQGKLLYVYRDFPLNAPALWASMVANCMEGERYFAFVDLLYKNQESWLGASDIPAALKQYAQIAGMDDATFERCINDAAEIDRIVAHVEYAQATYGVDSTPAVILNGSRVKPRSYEELSQMIADSLG